MSSQNSAPNRTRPIKVEKRRRRGEEKQGAPLLPAATPRSHTTSPSPSPHEFPGHALLARPIKVKRRGSREPPLEAELTLVTDNTPPALQQGDGRGEARSFSASRRGRATVAYYTSPTPSPPRFPGTLWRDLLGASGHHEHTGTGQRDVLLGL